MPPLISLIVPVYKSEAFLPTLVDSIQAQDFKDWELILVDDGSPDNSGILCDNLAKKDNRIVAVHKNNGGISSACNAGIDASRGAWLFLCDHDDYLTPDSLTLLSNAIQEPDVDLVAASYIRYKEDVLQEDKYPGDTKIVPVQQYFEGTCKSPDIRYNEYYLWNKLLKSSIIKSNNLRFREDIHYFQDVLFAYQYLFLCTQNVYCLDKPIYVYFKREIGESSSITHKYNPKKSPGRLYSQIDIYESFKASRTFISKETDEFLKNIILQSYFWLHHSILHSGFSYWPDMKKYVRAVSPYYSRWTLISKWIARHFRLRFRQFLRCIKRLSDKLPFH